MKRKQMTGIWGIMLAAAALTGCGAASGTGLITAKQTAVSEETSAEEEKETAEALETDTGTLTAVLGIPERYQREGISENGRVQVIIDAQVEVPQADQIPFVAVKQHPLDQDAIDRITKALLENAVIYSADSYYEWENAEGDRLSETEWQEADKKELEKVTPEFGLEYSDGQGGTYVGDNYFEGVACTPEGLSYRYVIKRYNGMPMEVRVLRIRERSADGTYQMWIGDRTLNDAYPQGITREELERESGISLEQARAEADEKVKRLELPGMELAAWEPGILWERSRGAGGVTETCLDIGYMLHYTRRINDVPITYTMEVGGNLMSMEDEMETWGYETLDIVVTREGIDQVEFFNQYDLGETAKEAAKLLPFSEIMDSCERMLFLNEIEGAVYTYRIDRITLGYGRIYDPSLDSTTGTLVPVWDFFGSIVYKGDGETEGWESSNAYQSYLTINAADGTGIRRGLGY